MCGFTGHLFLGDSFPPDVSVKEISHRGPDEVSEAIFGDLTLVFARLAINGVADGSQPFFSEDDGTLTVVNGEIYNHEHLRKQLADLGAEFRSSSDAEVVHWGFIFWGVDVFSKLEGMFATAIFEKKSNSLVFARDRLGKKPLYWMEKEDGISFASEIGALRISKKLLSPTSLASYLLSDAIAWEVEKNHQIKSLPGGYWARVNSSGVTISSFWSLENAVLDHRAVSKSRTDWYDGFLDLVTESVSQRLMSEVPIGLFLSNGKDSKLVGALAARLGAVEVAYTLQFKETTYDESLRAGQFAGRLGITHELVQADIESLVGAWEEYKKTLDEPVADSAILGEILLAQAARPKTKVVLTGDGGDETLLGYQHVITHKLCELPGVASILTSIVNLVQPFLRSEEDKYFSAQFVADRFLRGSREKSLLRRDLAWRSSFSADKAQSMVRGLSDEVLADFYSEMESFLPKAPELNGWEDQWSFFYLRSYLHHVILRKVDRATMRFGVEARSPLLDRKVVEYALAMPARYKSSPFSQKIPVEYALRKLLGPSATNSRKHGMGIPLLNLFRGPLREEVIALADTDFLVHQGLFSPKAVFELVASFESAPKSHVREIWSMLVFQAWWKRRLSNET